MAEISYNPLTEPPFPVEEPSWLEKLCRFIPILGWIVSGDLWMRRLAPKTAYIAEQLRLRTKPTLDLWQDSSQRRAVASVVCEEIEREFDWPNSHFLPNDPLRLLLWRTFPDQELLFALFEIERRLGVNKLHLPH